MQETDGRLLDRFASSHDETAFRALVARYLGLIYHTALRRTGSRPIAEEVSQNVLCAVAKKAAALARHPDRLPAWLHRATLFESSKAMRSEASHHRRKSLRHPDEIAATGSGEDSLWAAARPHLDRALDRLPASDRGVILKHYFEGQSLGRIARQQGRPAATVQKQCRRALDKLARMLRGKGVALSAAALASGLGSQLAKAAPPTLLKTATDPVLAGETIYSTTQLTLFMAAKSKAVLPLALLVLMTPLILQQVAISRAAADNERLWLALVGGESAASARPARPLPKSTAAVSARRITISALSRALDEADRLGPLKQIEFREMIESLDADELAALIPQAVNLPEPQQKRAKLLSHLMSFLTKLDPERAVKVTLAADPQGRLAFQAGIAHAVHVWTERQPDEAFDWLQKLAEEHAHVPPGEVGFAWDHPFEEIHAAALGALVMSDSPHVRGAILLMWEGNRGSLLENAFSDPTPQGWMDFNRDAVAEVEGPAKSGVERFRKFLPWIREFIPEGNKYPRLENAIQGLLRECEPTMGRDRGEVAARIMESVDLLPDERRWIAEAHALAVLSTSHTTLPRPDGAEVEASARDWLETHMPGEADEIFREMKATARERELFQTEHRLRPLAEQDVVRDSDLIRALGQTDFREFPGFLPLGLEQAKRIKDPVKREEMLRLLKSQTENP